MMDNKKLKCIGVLSWMKLECRRRLTDEYVIWVESSLHFQCKSTFLDYPQLLQPVIMYIFYIPIKSFTTLFYLCSRPVILMT